MLFEKARIMFIAIFNYLVFPMDPVTTSYSLHVIILWGISSYHSSLSYNSRMQANELRDFTFR